MADKASALASHTDWTVLRELSLEDGEITRENTDVRCNPSDILAQDQSGLKSQVDMDESSMSHMQLASKCGMRRQRNLPYPLAWLDLEMTGRRE